MFDPFVVWVWNEKREEMNEENKVKNYGV